MSRFMSVLLGTEEWASCRLLYFRFCLSRASCGKLVKVPLLDACGRWKNALVVDANMLQDEKMQSCGIFNLNETNETNETWNPNKFVCFQCALFFICSWDLLSVCRLMGAVLWRWLVKGFLQNHGDLFFSRTPACMSMRDSESVLHILGSAQWTRTHCGPSWIEDWHYFVQGLVNFHDLRTSTDFYCMLKHVC